MDDCKLGYITKAQGAIVADNLTALSLGGTAAAKLKQYTVFKGDIMALPTGRNGGVLTMFGFVFGDFMTRNLKSANLFTDTIWAELKEKI
jgi:hypothetical protein